MDGEGAATNGADESVIIYVNENFHIQDIGSDAISFAPSVAGSNLSLVTDNVFNRAAVILVMISPPKLLVTSINPTSGTALGGTPVTIRGNDFQSEATVTFRDSAATDIVVISSDTITAVTPAHPAGTVDVIVTNPNGLSDTLSSGFTFLSHPDVTSIDPVSGTELGGTSVTISGSDFQSGSTVTFGDSAAIDIVVISSGTITAVTPAHPAGTVDVVVTNPNGLSDTLSSPNNSQEKAVH